MRRRNLGASGLKVSEIAYGNWITHGLQVEEDAATACVRAALDVGISTFDTADVYANTIAEEVLGRALAGTRRESVEILTKLYWPVGLRGHNDSGLSRKHIMEGIHGSLRRLSTDYVDLYQAHRYDHETPLEETMLAFADVVRQGKALYIGVSEWRAEEIRAAAQLAMELHVPLVSNQPQYNMLWRVIESEVIPASVQAGMGQVVWSPIAQGVLAGKYAPGQPLPEGSRAADAASETPETADAFTWRGGIKGFLDDDLLTAVSALRPIADDLGLSMAQLAVAWVLDNPNVSAAIVGASRPEQLIDNAAASGVCLDSDVLALIDKTLDGHIITDPALTASPPDRTFGPR